MFGRIAMLLAAATLLAAGMAQVAFADGYIAINDQYQMSGKNIIVHVLGVNISDYPTGNVYPYQYPGQTRWVRIDYTFENPGDVTGSATVDVPAPKVVLMLDHLL